MRAKIKAITFDLDDTFWDIGPVIINAEIKTREWIESSLDEEINAISNEEIHNNQNSENIDFSIAGKILKELLNK